MTYWQYIVGVLTPPHVEDEGEYRTIRIVHTFSIATIIGISVLVVSRIIEGYYSLVPPMFVACAVSLGAIVWSRNGRVTLAGAALSWTLLAVLEYFAWTNSGLTDTSLMAIPGVLVVGGLVLKRWHFYFFAAACVLATALLGYLDLTKQIHIVHFENVGYDDILDIIVIFGITAVTVRVLADGLIRNLRIVQENEREIRIQSAQLRLSEERYRTLFEGANDAIIIMNEEGFVETNSMALTMFGCAERSELVGHGPWVFSDPYQPDGRDSKQKALDLMKEALDGMPQRFNWRHRRRDGTSFDAEVSLNRIVADSQSLVQATIRDVTERIVTEEALRKSDERFRLLFNSMNDAVFVHGITEDGMPGMLLEVNEVACVRMGYSRDEMLHMTPLEFDAPETIPSIPRVMEIILREGFATWEGMHVTRAGKKMPVEISNHLFELDGKPTILATVRDITEQKQAEERLRNLAHAIRSISESVYVTDTEGNVAFVNEAFGKTFGYGEHEVVGKRDTVFLSPDNFPDVLQVMREASRLGGWRGEVYCRRNNGGRFEVQLSLSPIRNERGDVIALVGVATDITNRKMVERALRESEEKFRTIVNTTSEWIWDLSVSGTLTYSNPAVKTILGYDPEELIGNAAFDHIHGDDREKIAQLLPRCVKQKQGWRDLVIRWRHKDGSYRFLESNSTPVIDLQGELTGFHGADRDITDRKLMEDRLRISEEYYRTLVDTSPDAIVIVDTNGFLSFVSQKAYEMFDVPKGNIVIGTSVTDWLVPTRRKEVIRTLASVLSGDSKAIAMEVELLKHDRTAFWAEVSTSPLANVKGEVRGLLLICRDVSERKGAEEALRQAQRMESIGILAGGIAHDFNNLLQAILGQAHLALNKLPLNSEGRANIEKAEKAAERAAHLTRQLLAYSGQGKLNMHTLDINTIIRDHVPLLAMTIPKVVSLKLDLHEAPLYLKGDGAQIQQTVINLVINAAEAMEGRSGQIRVGSAKYTISASDVGRWTRAGGEIEPGAYVGFEVSDNGCGMDDQTLARIFDPFFTTKFTGRGLGLPAVLGIVRGHRGALQVESKKGAGTTFRVAFPETEREMDSESTMPPAEGPSDRVTVLLIDDEEVVREVFTETLSDGGFRILVASDGESGVELFKQHLADISLIVLDLSMPGIDGAETFKRIRVLDPNAKVILSSGYAEEEAMDRFEGLGLAGFLQKPYQWSRLVQILRGYIR